MIEHIWSDICERSLLDKDTNLLSLINIFEELTIHDKISPEKIVRGPIEVVSLWVRSDVENPEKGFSKYSFISPSGEILNEKEVPLDLTKYERVRNRVQFISFPLPEAGIYYFQVDHKKDDNDDWVTVANVPMKVIYKDE